MATPRADASRMMRLLVALVVIGGLVGTSLAVGLLAALGLYVDGLGGFPYYWDAFFVAGFVGGLLGALALPIVSLIFLPNTVVARIVLETSTGTSAGAAIGLLASRLNPLIAVVGAISGFFIAVLGLWMRRRQGGQAHFRMPPDTR